MRGRPRRLYSRRCALFECLGLFSIGLVGLVELQAGAPLLPVLLVLVERLRLLLPRDGRLEVAYLGVGGGERAEVKGDLPAAQLAGAGRGRDSPRAVAKFRIGAGSPDPGAVVVGH